MKKMYLLIALLILTGCVKTGTEIDISTDNLGAHEKPNVTSLSPNNVEEENNPVTEDNTSTVSFAEDMLLGEYDELDSILQSTYDISYETYSFPEKVITSVDAPNSTVAIYEFDSCKLLIYHNERPNQFDGIIQVDEFYYDIGGISMFGQEIDNLIMADSIIYNDCEHLKITGILGANYASTAYYQITADNICCVLEINGIPHENDINKDGIDEIIVTVDTIPKTYIYVIEENETLYADLPHILQTKCLTYDESTQQFTAYYPNSNTESVIFQMVDNTLILSDQ